MTTILPRAEWVALTLLVAVTSAACGLAISAQAFPMAVAIPVAALGAALLPLISPGVFVGLALVLANNAVPGVDLEAFRVAGVNGTDLAFLTILGFAVVRWLSAPAAAPSHALSRLLWVWAFLFLAVWSLAFVRALDAGTDFAHAALAGHDFLLFGLTLPFASSLLKNRTELRECCKIVAILSVSLAATYIVTSLGLASIANSSHIVSEGPLRRIDSPAYNLLALTFSVSFAYALLNTGRDARLACVMAVVTAVAIAFSLTRALYVGVLLALVLSLIVWGLGQGSAGQLLRRRLILTALVVALVGSTLLVAVPGVAKSGPVHRVVTRASSISPEFSSPTPVKSHLAYRVKLESRMAQILGPNWPLGLGFLDNHTHYFVDLPEGRIRNNDTGVFNAIMTMGVVGTVLLYFAPISLLGVLLLRARSRSAQDNFLFMGGTTWLLTVLIASYTLDELASVPGLATTAVGIGVLLYALASSVPTRDLETGSHERVYRSDEL